MKTETIRMIKMNQKRLLELDDILEELGELGTYQIFIYILLCIPVLFCGCNSFSYVFTAAVPSYRCFVPECENHQDTSFNASWLNWAIPNVSSQNRVIGIQTDSCSRYLPKNVSELNSTTCSPETFTKTVEKCTEWIFENNERTIVNDWNLTCLDNQWKISLVGTSHFIGIILGTVLCGVLADRYGRKLIFLICILLMSVTGALQVVSPEYITFVVMTVIYSAVTAGVYPLAFILGVEMVGKKKRELTGMAINYFYSAGGAIVAPIAWYTKDWVMLQLIVSLPALIFVSYYWIIPESVRWLLANKRADEAKEVLTRAAKINNVTLSDSAMNCLNNGALVEEQNVGRSTQKISSVLKEILTTRKLVIRFLIMYFIWAVNAFVYYGLSINSTSLSGDKYLNFALVSLAEIPGITLAWISIRKLGRRISLVTSLMVCGVTCIITIFVDGRTGNWEVIMFFLIGKLAVAGSFAIVFVYTAEMFPTIIRSGGVGSASTVARFGALLAPFAPMLALFFDQLPMIVFGGTAILAGLMALILPETLGRKLPETIEEALNI